jgi:hypothetical protein
MCGDAEQELREGLKNVSEAIVGLLSENGVPITADGVSWAPAWQAGEPIPAILTFEVSPIGRSPVQLEFSNEEIEDCWEGLDRAEVRTKLRELADKLTVVDRRQRDRSEKQRIDEAVAVLKTKFPRIHQNIVNLWGRPDGETFLDNLIMDDRGGRQGFPQDAMAALLLLQRVHFQKFGTFKKVDPWDIVNIGKFKA